MIIGITNRRLCRYKLRKEKKLWLKNKIETCVISILKYIKNVIEKRTLAYQKKRYQVEKQDIEN